MNNSKYKSAMMHLKTSKDFDQKTLAYLQSDSSKPKVVIVRKTLMPKVLYGILAVCFSAMIINLSLSNGRHIKLKNSDGNVKVTYVNNPPAISTQYDLQWLSEEEIFNHYDTSIFKGTVQDIQNIKIEMGKGHEHYEAIATIEINESYRGNEEVGDVVEILLPCPINSNIWVEDTGVISMIRIGMEGIFMPVKYDDTSLWEENGETLYLSDICEYGFLDGERFAFLETESGIVFADWIYESISNTSTFEDIKAYILKMIDGAE